MQIKPFCKNLCSDLCSMWNLCSDKPQLVALPAIRTVFYFTLSLVTSDLLIVYTSHTELTTQFNPTVSHSSKDNSLIRIT